LGNFIFSDSRKELDSHTLKFVFTSAYLPQKLWE